MNNTPTRFYLKVPRSMPLEPPVLRRTSIATEAQYCEPSYSIGKLCQMEFNDKIKMYNIKVFDYPSMLEDEDNRNKKMWVNVKWKIDKDINNIHYFVTSYFNARQKYIDKIGVDYLLCRPQFSPIILFCILKLKVLFIRKIKERFLKKKIGNEISKIILNYVPYTPCINLKLAIITHYTF